MGKGNLSVQEAAIIFFVKMNFKVFPLRFKDPAVESMNKIYNEFTTLNDVEKMFSSERVTGAGIVMGYKNLRGIDIDGIDNVEILKQVLSFMGLKENYPWVVQSGSCRGYHIYVYCDDEVDGYLRKNQAYYKFLFKDQTLGKQIELRWERSYLVAPYSLHPEGKQYTFKNDMPGSIPVTVSIDRILQGINAFCELKHKGNVSGRKSLTKADTRNLDDAVAYLKKHKLNYEEWIQCGFALASLGYDGKKRFVELSTNEFYNDDVDLLEGKFDYLLSRYDPSKITLKTLFGIATEKGYEQPKLSNGLNMRFVEFELCALRYDEDDPIKKIKMLRNYAIMRKLIEDKNIKELTDDVIKEEIAKSNFEEKLERIRKDFGKMLDFITDIIEKEGAQPICRIGEDFIQDVFNKKFDYLTFCILSAITAIQGKQAKYKNITKERLRLGIAGYKSKMVADEKSALKVSLISDHKIRVRINKLVAKTIISAITIYRITTYSTFYNQNELAKICENKYLKAFNKKNYPMNIQKRLNKRIREVKQRIIGGEKKLLNQVAKV
ncbi:MAG: bifunctional DNA primase/polymerase [Ignavibacterium sp.]|nr:bifunctional DNA primase/polymerase [Ignavibacterium sp.]